MKRFAKCCTTIWPSLISWISLALVILSSVASAAATTVVVPTGSDPLINGDNFQSAVNTAACGDTIILTAGATYATRVLFTNSYGPQGNSFSLPNKSCAPGQYVSIQTSAVGSLPSGRISPSNIALMATLATNTNAAVVYPAVGAGNYAFVGIEFTTTSSLTTNKGFASLLVGAGNQDAGWTGYGHDMVFDRVWIHPYDDVTNPSGTTRTVAVGIRIDGARQTIKNSYISGFCCRQSDDGVTIVASVGIEAVTGPGPLTIDNNFIEAYGWNIFTGGGGLPANPANQTTVSGATNTSATFANTANLQVGDYVAILVPPYTNVRGMANSRAYVVKIDSINGTSVTYHGMSPDQPEQGPPPANGSVAQWRGQNIVGITVTRNTLSKRAEWCSGAYGISKAVWEMKEGSNVLFEGNVVTLPIYTPTGAGCSPLTVAFAGNQDGSSPWGAANNNVFRSNLFRGLSYLIEGQTSSWYHALIPPTGPLTLTNNLFDGTPRLSFLATDLGVPGWSITHNTVRGNYHEVFASASPNGPVPGITLKDNIMNGGVYWFNPLTSYPGLVEDHNIWINNQNSGGPPFNGFTPNASSPVVANDAAVGFVDVRGADAGGDYHGYALASTSPYKGRASDGTDPGVNFETLDAALSGVGGGGTTSGGGGATSGSGGTTSGSGGTTSGSGALPAPTNLIVK